MEEWLRWLISFGLATMVSFIFAALFFISYDNVPRSVQRFITSITGDASSLKLYGILHISVLIASAIACYQWFAGYFSLNYFLSSLAFVVVFPIVMVVGVPAAMDSVGQRNKARPLNYLARDGL
jgi:type IV secretory pathway VirB6-like protein